MESDDRSNKMNTVTYECEEISLSIWQEIVGQCIDTCQDYENTSVTLRVSGRALKVAVPGFNHRHLLPKLVGKWVGILRTDDLANRFVVRRIREGE